MPDHFKNIYATQAESYHQLIIPEDADNNLLPTLERVTPLQGKRILDLGTGTGRIPLLTNAFAAQIIGLDLHEGMLREHQRQRMRARGNWPLLLGDMCAIPIRTAWADITTAGWALGHFQSWYVSDWQTQVDRVLQEMHRVTKPGGAIIILETMTTGSATPAPPSEELAQYYARLESKWGFTRQVISTDYVFTSAEEAARQLTFFFGLEMAQRIRENNWARVLEWTGVWGKITGS